MPEMWRRMGRKRRAGVKYFELEDAAYHSNDSRASLQLDAVNAIMKLIDTYTTNLQAESYKQGFIAGSIEQINKGE